LSGPAPVLVCREHDELSVGGRRPGRVRDVLGSPPVSARSVGTQRCRSRNGPRSRCRAGADREPGIGGSQHWSVGHAVPDAEPRPTV